MIRYSSTFFPFSSGAFSNSVGGSVYGYAASYITNGTFKAPKTGRYKIYVWGASSNGGAGGGGYNGSTNSGGDGGAGGSTGGFCAHWVKLEQNNILDITVTATESKVINTALSVNLVVTAGILDSNAKSTPGTASGGNIVNLGGAKGGAGGRGGYDSRGSGNSYHPSSGLDGGNGGAAGGVTNATYARGGGGGGGARAVGSDYCKYVAKNMTAYSGGTTSTKGSDMPAITPGPNILITGAGCGSGGANAPSSSGYTPGISGTIGQPGAVIIEMEG